MDKLDNLSEKIIVLGARGYPLFRRIFSNYHPDEVWILHILRMSGGGLPRKRLIRAVGLDEKIVSRRIRGLVTLGFVESYRDANSARESIDKITVKGNEEFEKIRNKIKALLNRGFTFMGEKEEKVLFDIISRAEGGVFILEKVLDKKL